MQYWNYLSSNWIFVRRIFMVNFNINFVNQFCWSKKFMFFNRVLSKCYHFFMWNIYFLYLVKVYFFIRFINNLAHVFFFFLFILWKDFYKCFSIFFIIYFWFFFNNRSGLDFVDIFLSFFCFFQSVLFSQI